VSPLDKVEVTLDVAVGARTLSLGDVMKLQRGALIELERAGPGKADLRVGHQLLGQGRLDLRDGEKVRIVIESLGVKAA
jgi:flagellar motor switch/type III secretory pathway protein FliN